MDQEKMALRRGGGYVINERNQFQEDSRILFNPPGCRDSFEGMVYYREEG